MMEDIIRIKSISQLHEMMGFTKPTHPLISILDTSKWEIGKEWVGVKATSDLYTIGLKDKSCGLEYGRNSYDFGEGVMIFTAPNQVVRTRKAQMIGEISGWMLFFHPDLIRNTPLGKNIENYHFFSYDVHEALHLSDAEQRTVTECIEFIQSEINQRIDNHSQRVIVSSLELILNYCIRFYERQFNTRSAENKDVISQFEFLLKDYYASGKFAEAGIPTIEYFAGLIHLSQSYLSDLLRKETGYTAKDHLNNFIVERAKTMLLGETDSVSEIAYKLGFNYPHYFSRLFKSKTGLSPQEYRRVN
ncbi:helix-turn-helix domain-containing protein [Chitinophaga sp. ysch24]|uniref:Helix-turn-helix domain-containing protein n=2 Tax=Chitinophaga tropicalis TaxID=2683588 RepID=A0A7K1U388_9BACT|nr:helix-turn-helix domain-containing protein [Chitinophaga tropicalis]